MSLQARLVKYLDTAQAEHLSAACVGAGGADLVEELLDELSALSKKVEQAAVEALPDLYAAGGIAQVVPWFDCGIALAHSSGAISLKYWKESPILVGLLPNPGSRQDILTVVLELADQDPNVALEFLRASPELVGVLPQRDIQRWAEMGLELSQINFIVGIEFIRQSHAVASVLPLNQIRDWVAFGMKLITENSLGKTDYLGTLEFFRTSPAILGDIDDSSLRGNVVSLGSVLADESPHRAITFLSTVPTLLRRLPSPDWGRRILSYGHLMAERDHEATLAYLRQCPTIFSLLGEGDRTAQVFEQWFKTGMEVLELSLEGGRAYFSLETKSALASLEEAMSGVPLRRVARSLKLFVQGLCGVEVSIQPLPIEADNVESHAAPARATVSQDGRTIFLPPLLRRRSSQLENQRLYTVMAAHEAGHLEFGTYDLQLDHLQDIVEKAWHHHVQVGGRDTEIPSEGEGAGMKAPAFPRNLADVFRLYPQPALIRDLWTVLEDARVEYHLQRHYPGLRQDLAALAREALKTRSLSHGMSVREMVVDALLVLTTLGPAEAQIPDPLKGLVDEVWTIGRTLFHPEGTAEQAVRIADRIYEVLEQRVGSLARREQSGTDASSSQDVGPSASELVETAYRPLTNFSYRGGMNPDMIQQKLTVDGTSSGPLDSQEDAPKTSDVKEMSDGSLRSTQERNSVPRYASIPSSDLDPHPSPDRACERVSDVSDDRRGKHVDRPDTGFAFVYDEWDAGIQDYRSHWCRVVERMAPEGASDFAERVLGDHGPVIRLLRRYFQGMRPPGFRRIAAQPEGEELDLDALVSRWVDRAAGVESTERIYIRRERRARDVAVAFLVDVSGSTSRQLPGDTRRVIDVEKEGLIVLSEALEALGDAYAVYGYSGKARDQVEFYSLKEFHEAGRGAFFNRLGAVDPLHQNRDGAAIRHATRKLLAQQAKVRLLIVLSDGKPLDEAYAEEYALQDTKMALREARMKGVFPFCITVDRQGDAYLRRMYGEVRYMVIDRVDTLPERLPKLYQRLTA